MKRYPLPVTFLAGALLLALVPADAAAQRRGGPAHGGRSVLVVRPAYGPVFIAEPQVNALLSLTKWMRLDAGVGYRLIGGADLLGDDLRGISGSIAVQIGGR